MTRSFLTAAVTVVFSAVLSLGCGGDSLASSADDASLTEDSESELLAGRAGAVYVLSNDAASNEVIVFRRASDGTLQRAASYATTGRGSGDGLGSQGALVLTANRRWLFAVNAGSNELSVFSVRGEALYLVDSVPTGGQRPVSVTENDGLVYVLHAGEGQNDITGFVQRWNGTLAPLPGSTRALSAASVGPAQVSFSPSGRALIVTEKGTNLVDEFRVDAYGLPSLVTSHPSSGQTPFGFAVTRRGQVIVSEAFGGAADASALSSYQLGRRSGLAAVSSSVPSTESAACWVALAKSERFAYVTNTASGTITAYSVSSTGALSLIDADGVAASTGEGSRPIDLAVSAGSRFLYVLEAGSSAIGVARIERDGSLTTLADVAGLPATAFGLAAQ